MFAGRAGGFAPTSKIVLCETLTTSVNLPLPAPLDDPLARYAALQTALDLIDQGFTLIDRNLRLVAWNESFLRLLDFPPDMVHAGATFESFIRYNAERGDYGPGDPQAMVAERVAMARRFVAHDFERARPNGQVLRITGVPVPGIGFITLYSDVSVQRQSERQIREHAAELERRVAERTQELRRSESQLRLITDSIPALIAYFDEQRAYRYLNRGYQEWFGLDTSQPEKVSAKEYLGAATYQRIRSNVARALAGEAVSYEYPTETIDGRSRIARTTLIPEVSAEGRVVGCFELTFDLTEMRRAEDMLAQAKKMEALGQLTSGLAHDFNNMLTVILGNLGAIQQADTEGQHAEYLTPALGAARRGAELIRNLMGFARRQPLEAQPVDVCAAAAAVIRLVRPTLPPGLEIGLSAPEGLPHAWSEASRLQDAFLNLILNARDAGASQIRITMVPHALHCDQLRGLRITPGPYVRIRVSDDGCGMTPAVCARVFEPFFTTKRPGQGTGLGLATVYGFVRQCEGAIDVVSTPGRGSSFTLWLPVAETPADAVDPGSPPLAGPEGRRGLALLVEDEAEVRKVVRRYLVDLGYAVLEAENGSEALAILEDTPAIELLLSDVMMPGELDGREVARRARERGVRRIVLMSGHASGSDHDLADVPLLNKPFDQAALAQLLRDHAPH